MSEHWNMLRTPQSRWYAFEKGKLSLELRPQTLSQLGNPSLLARRIRHHQFSSSLKLDFEPDTPNEKAGMVLYRSSACHYQFVKQGDSLVIIRTEQGESSEVARTTYKSGSVILKAEADGLDLQFSYGDSENNMTPLGEKQSMSVVSFEVAGGFNGPYVGMYANGEEKAPKNRAWSDWFEYQGK